MNISLTPFALATLVATIQFGGVANAQATKAAPTPAVKSVPAKAPITTKAPEEWIIYDDATYTPVVDDVSRHLDAARKAFDAKDSKKAAQEMRAVADALKRQAASASKEEAARLQVDKSVLAADTTYWQDSIARMNASALTVGSAAAAIESGQIKTKTDLDKAIDRAARADIDRRWLVADVTTWYPVTEEPQRHFMNAVAAYARKDYQVAAADIRKATSYVRLEAARASGAPKQALDSSAAQLDALAASVEKGSVKDEHSLAQAFATADHALAVEHRLKASESWARQDYDATGYDLKAAAFELESAASWAGAEAKAGVSATVVDTRALAEKLVSGGKWSRDEVAKGFESLENGTSTVGRKILGTS